MSFSVDMWNGFDIIKSSFLSNWIKMNQLIELLLLYSSHVKVFYEGLNNLYESTKNAIGKKGNIIFNDALNLLISSFKIESEQYRNHYNLIMKNIKELREKLEKLKINIQQNFNQNEENRINFKDVLNNLITKKTNFDKSCKEFYLNMAEEETYKIFELKTVNNNQTNNLKKVWETKGDYINFLAKSNEIRELFNKDTEKILVNLEKEYKDLLYYLEYLIKTYIKDKIFTHKEISESYRLNNENTFDKINYKDIFNNFILKNATKEFPMNELDFIPFKLNENIFIQNNQKNNKYIELSKNDQNKVFNLIQNHLKNNKINLYENDFSKKFLNQPFIGKNLLKGNEIILDDKKEEKEEVFEIGSNVFEIIYSEKSEEIKEKNENFNFIKDFIITLVIEETESNNKDKDKDKNNNNIQKEIKDFKVITEDERIKYNALLVKFMKLIEPKNKYKFDYLNFFIKFLTISRTKGLFKLNPFVYQIFINIFTYILMKYKNSYDYVKNVILLAQTFYKGNDKKSGEEKIYLLNGLKNHAAFKEPETWHRAINYILSLSIKKINKYSLDIINKDEYFENLNRTAMNIIISSLYDMKISTNDTIVYENVKHFYSQIYKLDEKIIDEQVNISLGNSIKNNEVKNEKQINKIEENKDIQNDNKDKKENK